MGRHRSLSKGHSWLGQGAFVAEEFVFREEGIGFNPSPKPS